MALVHSNISCVSGRYNLTIPARADRAICRVFGARISLELGNGQWSFSPQWTTIESITVSGVDGIGPFAGVQLLFACGNSLHPERALIPNNGPWMDTPHAQWRMPVPESVFHDGYWSIGLGEAGAGAVVAGIGEPASSFASIGFKRDGDRLGMQLGGWLWVHDPPRLWVLDTDSETLKGTCSGPAHSRQCHYIYMREDCGPVRSAGATYEVPQYRLLKVQVDLDDTGRKTWVVQLESGQRIL